MGKQKLNENLFVQRNEGLVVNALRKYYFRNDFDDILQEGRIALLIAYRKYKNNTKIPWGIYATIAICNYVKNRIIVNENRQKRLCKNLISIDYLLDINNVSNNKLSILASNENIENEIIDKIEAKRILSTITNIRNRLIYKMYYIDGLKQNIIAKQFDITGSRVQQIVAQIKSDLQKENVDV